MNLGDIDGYFLLAGSLFECVSVSLMFVRRDKVSSWDQLSLSVFDNLSIVFSKRPSLSGRGASNSL